MRGRSCPTLLSLPSAWPFAAAWAGIVGVGAACIVAPAPDPAQWPPSRPSIVHNSVVPGTGEILTELPVDGTLLVPVELDDPNESFAVRLFVDYDPNSPASLVSSAEIEPSISALDGGIMVVPITLDTDTAQKRLSLPFCHRIEVVVAHAFLPGVLRAFDSVGGDSVGWLYNGMGVPGACPPEDAGAPALADAADVGAEAEQ